MWWRVSHFWGDTTPPEGIQLHLQLQFTITPESSQYKGNKKDISPPKHKDLPTTYVGTCEASRSDSNSNRTTRFELDSKETYRFENFESAAHAECRHTTNYAHSLFNKNINLCAVCSWDLCLQLHFTCSCTVVARAHTQLPHDNRHWTCKRLPRDSIRDTIRAEISDSQVPILSSHYPW